MSMSEYTKHRTFIHDVSNEMAMAEGGVRRVQKLLDQQELSSEVRESLDMASKHASECIKKLKEYRSFIHDLERQAKE